MKKLLFFLLLVPITATCFEQRFTSREECIRGCWVSLEKEMEDSGLKYAREEDIGSYIAEIRVRADKCIKECKRVFNE